MRSARVALTSIAKASEPFGNAERMQLRISLDMMLTLAITVLAVGMALGYQVMRRLGPRSAGSR